LTEKKCIITKANIKPIVAKIKGNSLYVAGINSASTIVKFFGKTKIDCLKKSDPAPKNMSLQKYPENILPTHKMIKGISNNQFDSCEWNNTFLLELFDPQNAK